MSTILMIACGFINGIIANYLKLDGAEWWLFVLSAATIQWVIVTVKLFKV